MLENRTAELNRAFGVAPPADPREDWLIEKAEITGPWSLHVVFFDGTHGNVDLGDFVNSPAAGGFAALRNQDAFRQAYLCLGALTWPGELDLAPDAMYDDIKETGVYRPYQTSGSAFLA